MTLERRFWKKAVAMVVKSENRLAFFYPQVYTFEAMLLQTQRWLVAFCTRRVV